MDFSLDQAQQAIVQVAGDALSAAEAWKELGRSGMLSLPVPTFLGGEGLGMAEVGVLLAEVGRRAVAVPALATLALGALPVARWGSEEQQRDLLSGLASGTVLTAALRGSLSTSLIGVPYAAQAYRILVPVGQRVALVDPTGPGVTLIPTPTSTGAPEYTVRFSRPPVRGMLPAGSAADLYRYAVAGACAVGDGAVSGALALTAAHVRQRHQFGRPLATFQAVAQQIADGYVTARTLHLATVSACWRLGTGRDAEADLAVAGYWLASQAPAVLRTCHHLHGGLGLDASYPLHRYSSLVKDLVRFLGGAQHRLDLLGRPACTST